jgi:hypothetical protein
MKLSGKDLLAAEVIDAMVNSGSLDGFDIQEMLLRADLLYVKPMRDDAPEEERCGNCEGECGECYRLTDEAKALHDAFEEGSK